MVGLHNEGLLQTGPLQNPEPLAHTAVTTFTWATVAGLLVAGCMIGDAGSSVEKDVRGPDRQPLAGVHVYLDAPAQKGTHRYFRADSAVTDSSGCYHLFSLHAPGSIRVSYSGDGYRGIELTAPGGDLMGRVVLEPTMGQRASHGVLRPLAADSLDECS